MDKTLCFAYSLQSLWEERLSLSLAPFGGISTMALAANALGTLGEMVPPGFRIARQKFVIDHPSLQEGVYHLDGKILKQKTGSLRDYLLCETSARDSLGKGVTLETTLLKQGNGNPDVIPRGEREEFPSDQELYSTAQQIAAYCQLAGDPNPIHTGVSPLVPGMLLLLHLEAFLKGQGKMLPQSFTVEYLQPVYAGEGFHFMLQPGSCKGIHKSGIFLQLQFQEDVTIE